MIQAPDAKIMLFARIGCPYCDKVIATANELGLPYDLKDVNDPKVIQELIERGGKRQMPYLVDEARGVSMYESEDIDRYLREHYPRSS